MTRQQSHDTEASMNARHSAHLPSTIMSSTKRRVRASSGSTFPSAHRARATKCSTPSTPPMSQIAFASPGRSTRPSLTTTQAMTVQDTGLTTYANKTPKSPMLRMLTNARKVPSLMQRPALATRPTAAGSTACQSALHHQCRTHSNSVSASRKTISRTSSSTEETRIVKNHQFILSHLLNVPMVKYTIKIFANASKQKSATV